MGSQRYERSSWSAMQSSPFSNKAICRKLGGKIRQGQGLLSPRMGRLLVMSSIKRKVLEIHESMKIPQPRDEKDTTLVTRLALEDLIQCHPSGMQTLK